MGISGPKARPSSVEGGFMDQNELRGFVEGGVDIGTKTSLKLALEKIRAELRHECAGKAVNRGILEYLEKGGNPLKFKHEDFFSRSVQSTSLKCNKTKQKDEDANDDETSKTKEKKKKNKKIDE